MFIDWNSSIDFNCNHFNVSDDRNWNGHIENLVDTFLSSGLKKTQSVETSSNATLLHGHNNFVFSHCIHVFFFFLNSWDNPYDENFTVICLQLFEYLCKNKQACLLLLLYVLFHWRKSDLSRLNYRLDRLIHTMLYVTFTHFI